MFSYSDWEVMICSSFSSIQELCVIGKSLTMVKATGLKSDSEFRL